jgi:hypothetical protein
MVDTPSSIPLDPSEQRIYDELMAVKEELTLLGQDRTTYIKSSDVMLLYDKVIDQVAKLNDLREESSRSTEQNRGMVKPQPRILMQ